MYRHRPEVLATDRGEGPALVCAHGTLMDRTMFAPQFALADDYRVVAYDLRARTDNYHGPYDLDDLVEDCRTTLDALGIESCVLAGMSMGGFMALRFALEHPDRLDGLVLIDSMAEAHTDTERERYSEMTETTREFGRPPDQLADAVSYLLFGETTRAERPDLVEEWIDRWRTYPGEAVYGEVDSWLDRPDLTDRLDEIEVPVLAVHGEEDDAIEIERGERTVEGLPDARLVPVVGAGHSSNLERPEPVNAAVREFLGEVYG
ncbi:alpha/beta hydrolase [Halobacteriales archaeon QS_8_69_26]|nr:MAG: alpha/beta hydrolase [Halobacteriales archaeon QS_8_69_26]